LFKLEIKLFNNSNQNQIIEMKKALIYSSFALLLSVSSAFSYIEEVQCVASELKAELKQLLKPEYKYDSSQITRVSYKKETSQSGIEVPLFMGEKYRFLFNIAGLPKDIDITIYDRKPTSKNKIALFSLKDVKEEGKHIYSFEPVKSKKMYIVYSIPATEEQNLSGFVAFLLGYKL